MRLFFLLVLLAGLGAGILYPLAIPRMEGTEVGRFRVFDGVTGPAPAVVHLSSEDSPLRIEAELRTSGDIAALNGVPVLHLAVTAGERTVLAENLSFSEAAARQASPQLAEWTYREVAGTIAAVADGEYRFAVSPADAVDASRIRSVELVLGLAPGLDPRVQPIGFVLIAIGFVGLVLSLRKGRPSNSPPRGPRWGRGGGSG